MAYSKREEELPIDTSQAPRGKPVDEIAFQKKLAAMADFRHRSVKAMEGINLSPGKSKTNTIPAPKLSTIVKFPLNSGIDKIVSERAQLITCILPLGC